MIDLGIIINPISGGDYPILSIVQKASEKGHFNWVPYVINPTHDIQNITQQALAGNHQSLAIYGGDGTISEVVSCLPDDHPPVLILSGGTANVLSKTLKIHQDPLISLSNFQNYPTKKIDTFIVNGKRRFIMVGIGSFSRMIDKTTREEKRNLGQMAYVKTFLENLNQTEIQECNFVIDGDDYKIQSNALMIANLSHVGYAYVTLHQDITSNDGQLDLLSFQDNDLIQVAQITTATLFSANLPGTTHIRGKSFEIQFSQKQPVLIDDSIEQLDRLQIQVSPSFLNLYYKE